MARDYSKYDKDALIAHIYELEKQLKNNKYGLYWDKSIDQEDVVHQCKTHIPVLMRDEELCMISNPDLDTHILIEGDNFQSLTALNMMCGNEGFVDIIYIDPPYNTGNKDFVYNDEFVDSEDGFIHSKWISFMKKRLELARSILKNSGSIFISIDDNEVAQLKLLCEEIFGSNNYVGTIVWKKKTNGNNMGWLPPVHDYILCFAKKIDDIFDIGEELSEEDLKKKYSNPDNDPRGPWTTTDLSANHKGPYFPIENPATGDVFYPPAGRYWVFNEEEVKLRIADGRIIFGKSGTARPVQRVFAKDRVESKKKVESWWDKHGLNADATQELKDIFGKPKVFTHPKPTQLIRHIVNIAGDNNAIVLDFFAGSGTTAQAVLELNVKDNGHRKCIVCTNNEGDICSDVTYPRIKTVITGKRLDGSNYSEGIPANLMYYKTDLIEDSRDTDQAKYCLVERLDELLCIIEETYVSKERTDHFSHYESLSGDKHTFIYSDYYSVEPFAEFLALVNSYEGDKIVYMFSTDNIIDEQLFEGIDGISVKPIPNKIYEIYKEIVEDIKRGEQ